MNAVELLLSVDAGKIEMPTGIHKMYCKKLDEEVEFEIKAIDPERATKIQQDAINIDSGNINGIDLYKSKVFTIIEGCSLFRNSDIIKHFNAPTPKELVKTILLNGEITSLCDAINELSNVKEIKTEDIKN